MNTEPSHLWHGIDYQCPEQLQLLPGHWSKRSCISGDLQRHNLFASNPIRNNMKSQIKNKISIVELLIPTLNGSSRYQFLLILLGTKNLE